MLQDILFFLNIFKRILTPQIIGYTMIANIFKSIIGLLIIVLSLMLLSHQAWYSATMSLIKGSVVILMILAGFLLTFLGLTELKSEI